MTKAPWIQNVSLSDIHNGHHPDSGKDTILIRIIDPNMEFTRTKHHFRSTAKYKFLDTEEATDIHAPTQEDAAHIVANLQFAKENNLNVLVHCVMGICRSGAVCEVGVMMGFEDTNRYRQPNLLLKHLLMKEMGWTYS